MHPIEGGFAWLVETVGVTFLLNLNLMAINGGGTNNKFKIFRCRRSFFVER